MEILVAYDVTTETREGRRRLQRVAKVCQAFGQRVQKSVFECSLSAADMERFRRRLLEEIDETEDSLRLYRLLEPREKHIQVIGKSLAYDMHGPLVV